MGKSHILCDMDGTILNTELLKSRAWKAAIEELVPGKKVDPDEHHRHYSQVVGTSTEFATVRLIELHGIDLHPEALNCKRKEIKAELYKDEVQLQALAFRETISFLERHRENGWKIILVTTSGPHDVEKIMSALNIDHLFTHKICGFEKSRENPEGYRRALEAGGVEASRCAALEDSPTGGAGANSLGIMTVIIPNSFTGDKDFSFADIIVRNRESLQFIELRR